MLIVLETFLSTRDVIVLSNSNNNLNIHYNALQPKPLNYNNYHNNNNNNDNDNNYNNVKINISEYLGENNSSSIEIERNNNNEDDNSIIPYNNDISLYHTNVSEKELDIDTPLLDNLNNFDKVNINNNIPEKYKEVRFKIINFN
jgi:hypothetical protein